MKNMAIINENGIVTNIIVCSDEEPETDRNISFTEENPAHIDGDYLNGFFYPPKPYPSWTRGEYGEWIPPVPMPDMPEEYYDPEMRNAPDEIKKQFYGKYVWNEEDQSWHFESFIK